MTGEDQAAFAAEVAAILNSTHVLGTRAATARTELATAMAVVVLARNTDTSFMTGTHLDTVISVIAKQAGTTTAVLTTQAHENRNWISRHTPLIGELAAVDPQTLDTYLDLFTNAVNFAAQIEPVDLPSLNTAVLLASTQSLSRPTQRNTHPGPAHRPRVDGYNPAPGAPAPIAALGSIPEALDAMSQVLKDLYETQQTPPRTPAPVPTVAVPAPTAEAPTPEPVEPPAVAPEPELSLEELYAQLDALTGLTTVKEEIRKQAELLRVQKLRTDAGLTTPDITRHLVFTGNPGTGKTTVARLVAKIYKAIGVLPQGQLIEVDKSGLVAGYVGQSEEKTAEVLKEAYGGVLFIDEAYSLTSDQYGQSVIDLLVKAAEDDRDAMVIIVAGYTQPMQKFINMNPGLKSRFRTVIEFPDYSDDELLEIFQKMVDKSDYTCTPETLTALKDLVAAEPRGEDFGNARFVRNCFEAAILRHAWRLKSIETPTRDQLTALTPEDLTGTGITLPPTQPTITDPQPELDPEPQPTASETTSDTENRTGDDSA